MAIVLLNTLFQRIDVRVISRPIGGRHGENMLFNMSNEHAPVKIARLSLLKYSLV